ncbi:hypothetical protein ACKEN4_17750, partial [Acinetobacter baumannii]|uniref:hypothetical protein n=1 Tax=Acinetobacter baumannii TaxID=470 RepID=UPI0038B5F17F
VDESVNPHLIHEYIEKVLFELIEIVDNRIESLASDISIIPQTELVEQQQNWNKTFSPYNNIFVSMNFSRHK